MVSHRVSVVPQSCRALHNGSFFSGPGSRDPAALSSSAAASAPCPGPKGKGRRGKERKAPAEANAPLAWGAKGRCRLARERNAASQTFPARGQGRREEREVTAAKEVGSLRGKPVGWKKVRDPAGAAGPLGQSARVSGWAEEGAGANPGLGASRGAGGCSGGCGAGAGRPRARCSPRGSA